MYKCLNCRKEIDETNDKVRCPYCGFRVYSKSRPEVVKRVQAR